MVLKEMNGNNGKGKTNGENGNGGKTAILTCGKTEKTINEEFARVIGNQPRPTPMKGKPLFNIGEVGPDGVPLPDFRRRFSGGNSFYKPDEVDFAGFPLPAVEKKYFPSRVD